jgi:hypothetical protein
MRLSRRCPATVVREARLLFPDNRIVSATNETAGCVAYMRNYCGALFGLRGPS